MGYFYSKSPEFAIYNSIIAMKENDYNKAAEELGNIINMIRLD